MKNKKGFTLVELLAVVAILSLLVIIALPNIMAMFKDAKERSFLTECKQIFKTAQQQWMSDSMFDTEEQTYTRCKTCTGKSLKLSGRQEIDYFVTLNKAGKVTSFKATDGTFQYIYEGEELKIEDIDVAYEISTLSEEDILTVTSPFNGEIYIAHGSEMRIGLPIPNGVTYYNSYPELLEVLERPVFLKHVIQNNVVKESYIGININGSVEYFRGGPGAPSYQQSVNHIESAFNNEGCFGVTNGRGCRVNSIQAVVYQSGLIYADKVGGCYEGCYIDDIGNSHCDPEIVAC